VVTPLVIRERTPVHLPRLKGSLIESSTGCGLISRMSYACGKSRWAFVHFRPSACRKASAVRPSFCSNQQIDFVSAKFAFFRELLEGLELVGGMHVFSGDAVQADLAWVVCSIDDAPDRLGLFGLLPLYSQRLGSRNPAAHGGYNTRVPTPALRRTQARWEEFGLPKAQRLATSRRGDVTKGTISFDGAEQHLSPNELVRRGCIEPELIAQALHIEILFHWYSAWLAAADARSLPP
jgi:hypothetical protein